MKQGKVLDGCKSERKTSPQVRGHDARWLRGQGWWEGEGDWPPSLEAVH